jgi:CMP-N-acetylneuraminic acid synthetase
MSVVAVIFARGGSQGIPHKNIAEVAGRPLLAWAIEAAKRAPSVDRVIVSTDSPMIAEVAEEHGAEVPFVRPTELAQHDSPEWFAWQHALEQLRDIDGELPEAMVSIPTTAPLREAGDIEACVAMLRSGDWDAVITVTPAQRSPSFNMVRLDSVGRAQIAVPPATDVNRRQDAPPLYDMCTVAYAARPAYVLGQSGLFIGNVGAVVIPQERSLDIDTPFDLLVADLVMRNR